MTHLLDTLSSCISPDALSIKQRFHRRPATTHFSLMGSLIIIVSQPFINGPVVILQDHHIFFVMLPPVKEQILFSEIRKEIINASNNYDIDSPLFEALSFQLRS